jgi:hypothetical protein
MTLPSSGAIKFSQLESEYTQNPSNSNISFSEFYYGGSKLLSNAASNQARNDVNHPGYASHFANIPSNGSISISSFRGKSAYYARQSTVFVSGNIASVDTPSIENEFWKSGNVYSAFFTVQTSGSCSSNSDGFASFRTQRPNRNHTTAYIVINHTVSGKGGQGGRGNNNGSNGGNGGTAMRIRTHTYLQNNSSIRGGGGGGGGGDLKFTNYNECYCCNSTGASISGSGGGGGQGSIGGAGGGAGDSPGPNFAYYGGNGGNGSESGPGNGGSGCAYNVVIGNWCSHTGGNGGSWGQPGGRGAGGGTFGGQGGDSVVRSDGIYYVKLASGTILGSETTRPQNRY